MPKSRIVASVLLVFVFLGFVIWNGSSGTNKETSITTLTTSTTPTTTTIPQVSFKAARAGGTGYDSALDVAVISDGGAIITGTFSVVATFGSTTLTSNGDADVFVGKISSAGEWVWATRAGGTGYDTALDASVTSDGGAIVTGDFIGTATFGSTTLTSRGEEEVFVGKISSAGVWVWASQAGGSGNDAGLGAAVTSDGGAIVTGSLSDTATFGSTTLTSRGEEEVFVGKISSAGEWEWASQAGGTGNDVGWTLAVTSDGGAIISGPFSDVASFGSTTLTSSGVLDVFVGKISSAGAWVWATQAGGTGVDQGLGVTATSDGGAIVTGIFSDLASFGSTTLTSSGDWDVLVGKISQSGEWVWVSQAGGTGNDAGFEVAVTSEGGAIVTGRFADVAALGSTTLTSKGEDDVFVGKISSTGVWVWVSQAGGTGNDAGWNVAVTSDGGAIITGRFADVARFGSTTLNSSGDADIFVAKVSSSGVWVS